MNVDIGFSISIILFYLSFAWFTAGKTEKYPYIRRLSKITSFKLGSPHVKVTLYSFSYIVFWIIISTWSFYLYSKYSPEHHCLSLFLGPILYFLAPHAISPTLTFLIFWKVPDDPLIEKPKFPFDVDFSYFKGKSKSRKLFLLGLLIGLFLTCFLPILMFLI